MKAFTKLSIISLLGSVTNTHAKDASVNETRKLQQSGRFCNVSSSVKCTIPGNTIYGTNVDCGIIGMQAYGTCKETLMTFSYEYCNLLPSNNVNPLRLNADGEDGTVAMYRQQWGKPALLLGGMGPGECRVAKVTELVDTCKKRVVGDIKFEGWVDGRVDEEGYYCYAYDFLEVPFYNEEEPPVTPETGPLSADVSLTMSCTHISGGITYDCESLAFREKQFNICNVPVTYHYTVINNSNFSTRLSALVDEKMLSITDSIIIDAEGSVSFNQAAFIDICESSELMVKKRGLAVASPDEGGLAHEAFDNLTFNAPSNPFEVELQGVACKINDGSYEDCTSYLLSIEDETECFVDIMFEYTFVKTSQGCGTVKDVTSILSSLGSQTLAFEDRYSCETREMCQGESITVPDRRVVNLCLISQAERDMSINVSVECGVNDRITLESIYEWPQFEYPTNDRDIDFSDDGNYTEVPEPPEALPVECTSRPVGIEFKIVPIDCERSSNPFLSAGNRRLNHKKGKGTSTSTGTEVSGGNGDRFIYSCDGRFAPKFPVRVEIMDEDGKIIYENANVRSSEETFRLSMVPNNMKVHVIGSTCDQEIKFSPDCSTVISTGDSFGSFTIVGFHYD